MSASFSLSRRGLMTSAAASAFTLSSGAKNLFAQTGALELPPATDKVEPFSFHVSQHDIDDLKLRLQMTRWPDRETVTDWSQGVPLEKAQKLIAYWKDHYDWRRFEARANQFRHFRTKIDGLGIHFIHQRSPHPDALPIILTHGWPGSFVEFMDIIEPLTNPTHFGGRAEDAFHVVIPSLPGYAFSDKPKETGWDVVRSASAWAELMKRLGYTRWVAQGGDWGSGVTHALAHARPQGLIAAHVNWAFVFPKQMPTNPTPAEKQAMDRAAWFLGEQSGYFRIHATRPQTVGYGLADSPSGLALWIYEKFQAWTDNHGNPEDALSVDAMLDDISLYWFTDTAASSARFYWENTKNGRAGFSQGLIELPMGASIFPHEIFAPPRHWAEAAWPNMFYWNELKAGGHFAAFEQPAVFVDEMRKAFKNMRA